MVDQLRAFAAEVTRVAREVGTEGMLGGQARVEGVQRHVEGPDRQRELHGVEPDEQVRNIADVTTAVASGDLSRKITVDVKGEVLELKDTINTMVDQLSSFADEVTRVAREVGTEGKLGGQANVQGRQRHVEGPDRQRERARDNLTSQVRNIAEVTTAVANGDLSQKITVDAAARSSSSRTRSTRWSTSCASFADEVTRVASEVGTEGKLGGQAEVEGVCGTWKDLTDNVNALADSLTTQVRAIADVATAVTEGRPHAVRSPSRRRARSTSSSDNINQMIAQPARDDRAQRASRTGSRPNLARSAA